MLILSRRFGRAVTIEDEMSGRISDIKIGNHESTGINTPKTVGVHRKEVYEHINSERGISKARIVGNK